MRRQIGRNGVLDDDTIQVSGLRPPCGRLGELTMLESLLLLIPWGKELLLAALTAKQPSWFLYYAAVAALGSAGGCFILDTLSRRGHRVLSVHVPRERMDFVQRQIKRHGTVAVSVAALMPPPFPFTAFLTTAGAFGYPRKKLLSTVAVARLVRFTAVAAAAAYFGDAILAFGSSPWLKYVVAAIIIAPIAYGMVSYWRKAQGRSRQ
jgi:membrane protein YqaA with SNARE-associated domain